jgi:uracil-DNA glycosylase
VGTDCAQDLEQVATTIRTCTKCPLAKTRTNAVPGEGPQSARLMFIGEAPGQVNDQVGRPFVGHGGRIFDRILNECGVERHQVFITNAVKCWPPENRAPTQRELDACRPYLEQQVQLIRPNCIFTLGGKAFKQLTGRAIKVRDDHGTLSQIGDIVVCPTFHPNGLRYIKGGMKTIISDIQNTLRHVAVSYKTGPAQGVLDLS